MTAQVMEEIVIDNKELPLCEQPLDQYFEKHNNRPNFTWPHTALWRGYIGSWLIENNQLFLTNINGYYAEGAAIDWHTLFNNRDGNIKADWYTGTLRIPLGEIKKYVHGGYASVYEKDMFIEVRNGNVTNTSIVENEVKEDNYDF